MKADGKKIKMAVGIAALVVIVAALALAAYRSVNTPERALERYFKAVEEQDYVKMYLLSFGIRRSYRQAESSVKLMLFPLICSSVMILKSSSAGRILLRGIKISMRALKPGI